MEDKNLLNPFNSNNLIGIDNYFNELVTLYNSNTFPKILLLSGKKGSGKFTLVVHLLNYIFSKNTYNLKEKSFDLESSFHNKLINNLSENVIFLKHKESENIKIENIRNLKSTISKHSINNKSRFIILDDVEKYNINSSNALLKILEEPSENNFFILIDNKENKIIETISSRAIKMNIFLTKVQKKKIIQFFLQKNKIKSIMNFDYLDISPGLFLEYNHLLSKNNVHEELNFTEKIEKILNLYKKNKDQKLISLAINITESHFFYLYRKNVNRPIELNEIKNKIIYLINNFVKYNLNLKTVFNSIKSQFNNAK